MLLQELLKKRKSIQSVIRMTINVGDFYGGIFIRYASNIKFEEGIELILLDKKNEKKRLTFFAKMRFNSSFTQVESNYGYIDEMFKENIKFYGATPFFEVSEKLYSFSPITQGVFIELVKHTLKDVCNISGEFKVYEIPFKEVESYYSSKPSDEIIVSDSPTINHFYISDSVFNCLVNKSEELVIDDYNFPEFPEILLSCTWIKKLELFELLISEIPEELTNLHNLKSLTLKLKYLTKLPSSIHRLTNLEVLRIENTGVTELPENLFKLINLKELYVINNEGLKKLPDKISELYNLEILYAYSNGIKELPTTIFRLENLKVLHLNDNRLEEIPPELTALSKLKILDLKGNRLKQIPDDLFEMESLEEVDLSNNPSLNSDDIYDLLVKIRKGNKINLTLQ
ncbi:MAG: leucine-rich repeat domain-containing protein [Bacteroidetes bacterium]|nr:leucine-rich repeat domain-containing protein [Bacteroidota bacterium]